MQVLGLTGSIGMGKTTAAGMLRRLGLPVHDADQAVHRLFAKSGRAVEPVSRHFPDVLVDGAVDRKRLGERVFADDAALRLLESLVHPLVRQEALDFLKRHRRRRSPLVVLDIPLLYETGGDDLCDHVIVVSAPLRIQRQRVLKRPGMNEEKFRAVLARQLPDALKRRRADYVIQTGLGKALTFRQLARLVRKLRRRERERIRDKTGSIHA
ncbi:dephospho-CoA kinase [Fodinicurvata fenggangensis]|uniref:dephospho-CoA kinase n=1 Tax=Fodinicurvata fenggangensis TaxID=1121830 RepID=UPI00068C439A|nr:dephospho-CoA kinase [Fodinicurvata fenggangensis]